MKQRHQVFTGSFKIKVAREYMESDLSQSEIRQKYNIKGKGCITDWVRKFGLKPEPKEKRINGFGRSSMKKEIEKTKVERALQKKVKELEKQLEYEKLRSEAFDTMINIAEMKFDIPIRKKRGTKQS